MTACFTGHRPHKLPWGKEEADPRCAVLKLRLIAAIEAALAAGCTDYLTGMAQGVDTYAAEAVLALKKLHPDITLHCVLPYRDQAISWAEGDRARHAAILDRADLVTTLSEFYFQGCMQQRNRYLVDHADRIIAVCGASETGGSAGTLAYAKKRGLHTTIIDIREFEQIQWRF